jgi:hypothetical protein
VGIPADSAPYGWRIAPQEGRIVGVVSARLPLAVGSSSLWSVARTAAGLVPGVILVVAAGISLAWGLRLLAILGGILGVYLFVFAVQHIRLAWQTRASDACLDQTHLRIDGGPHHGLSIPWTDIDPEATRLKTVEEPRFTLAKIIGDAIFLAASAASSSSLELAPPERIPLSELQLVTTDGTTRVLARAEHPSERASLEALLATIRGRLEPSSDTPPKQPPEVVGCRSCGAPVPPDDREEVVCSFCTATTAMPDALRERVRAHRQVTAASSATAATVTSLLEQPGATRANGVLLAMALGSVVIWTPILLGLWAAGVTDAGAFEVGWGLLAGSLLVLVGFVLARAALASRRALRLLTSSFGARPPERPGGAPGCRRCAGPLPPTDAIVVTCVFCEADNLLGLDLRPHVTTAKAHELSLSQVVVARDRERRRWRWTAIAMLPVALLAGAMATASVVVGREFRAEVVACHAGDAEACDSVSTDYDLGISVAEDDVKAFEYARIACDLGHPAACWTVAQDLYWGWGTNEDSVAAEPIRVQACELGVQEACAGF